MAKVALVNWYAWIDNSEFGYVAFDVYSDIETAIKAVEFTNDTSDRFKQKRSDTTQGTLIEIYNFDTRPQMLIAKIFETEVKQ